MISFLPIKEEINAARLEEVKSWIMSQAAMERKAMPNIPCALWVMGSKKHVVGGYWEVQDNYMYVGNATGKETPLWAPAALLAIAEDWAMRDDEQVQRACIEMLARIMAKAMKPVLTNMAEAYNGLPVVEFAVNEKQGIVLGKYPNPDGTAGEWRHFSGEKGNPTGPDWMILKM